MSPLIGKVFINNIQNVLFLSLFAIYFYTGLNFVWIDGLTAIASDSANYMLMGLYISPWKDASHAIQMAWTYQDFPPLFPILLAMSGTVHNYIAAHVFTLLFLFISFPFIYLFAQSLKINHWQSLTIILIFAISPSAWMNMLGILSENLYILISFLILSSHKYITQNKIKYSILFGLMLCLLLLTRSIGISMLIAYTIYGFIAWRKEIYKISTLLIPIGITVSVSLISKLLHQSSIPTQYINQFKDLTFGEQLKALIDAWFKSWQFYWTDELFIPWILVLVVGILAVTGLVIRLKNKEFDGYYLLLYLLILLVWPHPGQAVRFLYPVLPLLLIYVIYTINIISNTLSENSSRRILPIVFLLMLAIVIPPQSYIFNRYKAGNESAYNQIKDFYRIPDLNKASEIAELQKLMLLDFKSLGNKTVSDDVILYFEPTYVALLSNRIAKPIKFNEEYSVTNLNEADYIYLSQMHPRKSQEDTNGLLILNYIDNVSLLDTTISAVTGMPISHFLKINKNE